MTGRREEIEEWDEETGRAAPPEAEDAEAAAPEYRRRRKPVRVRRRRAAEWAGWWRRGWRPLLAAGIALGVAAGCYGLVFDSSWFVLAGSDQITVSGARQADPARILGVFASDLGRNVFFIPLSTRRAAIESIPWVRTAAVLRLWPARLQVRIAERVPVAYARVGARLQMLDDSGVVLDRPREGGSYDFPVLTGLAGVDAGEPNAPAELAKRQAQMKLYRELRTEMSGTRDGAGRDFFRAFSEIDLSDATDVKTRVSLPAAEGASGGGDATVLIHLGDRNFAARYALFEAQIAGWQQKYPLLASVDLRYDGEAIVDPGTPAGQAAHPASQRPGGRR